MAAGIENVSREAMREYFAYLLSKAREVKSALGGGGGISLGGTEIDVVQTVGMQVASGTAPPAATGTAIPRQELAVKLLSTVLGLTVSFAVSYFGIKWLANAMDPTRQEKKDAQKRVCGIVITDKIW